MSWSQTMLSYFQGFNGWLLPVLNLYRECQLSLSGKPQIAYAYALSLISSMYFVSSKKISRAQTQSQYLAYKAQELSWLETRRCLSTPSFSFAHALLTLKIPEQYLSRRADLVKVISNISINFLESAGIHYCCGFQRMPVHEGSKTCNELSCSGTNGNIECVLL